MEYESTEAKKLVQLLETSEAQEKEYWMRRTRKNIIIWSLVLVLLALATTFVILGIVENRRYVDFELHYIKNSTEDNTAINNSEDRKATIYDTINKIEPPDDTEGYNFTGDYYNSSNYEVVVDGESNIVNSLTYEESIYMQYEMGYYQLTIAKDSLVDKVGEGLFKTPKESVGYNKQLFVVPATPYTNNAEQKENFLTKYANVASGGEVTIVNNNLYTLYSLYNADVNKVAGTYELIDIDGESNKHIGGFYGNYKNQNLRYEFSEVKVRHINGGQLEDTYLVKKYLNDKLVACNFSNNYMPKFVQNAETGEVDYNNIIVDTINGQLVYMHTGELAPLNENNANVFNMPGRDMVFYTEFRPDDRYMVVMDTTDHYTWSKIFENKSVADITNTYNLTYNFADYYDKYQADSEKNDWDTIWSTFKESDNINPLDSWFSQSAIVLNVYDSGYNINNFLSLSLKMYNGEIVSKDSANAYYYPYAKEGYTFKNWEIYTLGVDGKYYWKEVNNESVILNGLNTSIPTSTKVESHSDTCILVRPVWNVVKYDIAFAKNGGTVSQVGVIDGYSKTKDSVKLSLAVDSISETNVRYLMGTGSANPNIKQPGYDFVGWQIDNELKFNYSAYDCENCENECVCSNYQNIGKDKDVKHIIVSDPNFKFRGLTITKDNWFSITNGETNLDTRKLWIYATELTEMVNGVNVRMPYKFYYFGTQLDLVNERVSTMEIPVGYYCDSSTVNATAQWETIKYTAKLMFGIDQSSELIVNGGEGYNYIYGLTDNYVPGSTYETGNWFEKEVVNVSGVDYTVGINFAYNMENQVTLPSQIGANYIIYRRGYTLVGYNLNFHEMTGNNNISIMFASSEYASKSPKVVLNGSVNQNMGNIHLTDKYGDVTITPIWQSNNYSLNYMGVNNEAITPIKDEKKKSTTTHHVITKVNNSDNTISLGAYTYRFDNGFDNIVTYGTADNTAIMMIKLMDQFTYSTFDLTIEVKRNGGDSVEVNKTISVDELVGLFNHNGDLREGKYTIEIEDSKYAGLNIGVLNIDVVTINNVQYFQFKFSDLVGNASVKISNIQYDLVENAFASHSNVGKADENKSDLSNIDNANFIPANWYRVNNYIDIYKIYDYNKTAITKIKYILVQHPQNFAQYTVFDMLNIVGELPEDGSADELSFANQTLFGNPINSYFAEVMTINLAGKENSTDQDRFVNDIASVIADTDLLSAIYGSQDDPKNRSFSDLSLIERSKISQSIYEKYSESTTCGGVIPDRYHLDYGTNFYTIKEGLTYLARITASDDLYASLITSMIGEGKKLIYCDTNDDGATIEFGKMQNKVTAVKYSPKAVNSVHRLIDLDFAQTTITFGLNKVDDKIIGSDYLTYNVLTNFEAYNKLPSDLKKFDVYTLSGTTSTENNVTVVKASAMSNILVEVIFEGKYEQINDFDTEKKIETIKTLFTSLVFEGGNQNAELYIVEGKIYIQIFINKMTENNVVLSDVEIYVIEANIGAITNSYDLLFNNRFNGVNYSFNEGIVGDNDWITIKSTNSNFTSGVWTENQFELGTGNIYATKLLMDGYKYTFNITIGGDYYVYNSRDNDNKLIVKVNGIDNYITLVDNKYVLEITAEHNNVIDEGVTISFVNVYRKVNTLTLNAITNYELSTNEDIYSNNVFLYNAQFDNLIKLSDGSNTVIYNGNGQTVADTLSFDGNIDNFFYNYYDKLVADFGVELFTQCNVFEITKDGTVYRFVTNGDLNISSYQNADAIEENNIKIINTSNATEFTATKNVSQKDEYFKDLILYNVDYVATITADTNLNVSYTMHKVQVTSNITKDKADGSGAWLVDYVNARDGISDMFNATNIANMQTAGKLREAETNMDNVYYDTYLIVKFKAKTGYDREVKILYDGAQTHTLTLDGGYNSDNIYGFTDGGFTYYVILLNAKTLTSSAQSFSLTIEAKINEYTITSQVVDNDIYTLSGIIKDSQEAVSGVAVDFSKTDSQVKHGQFVTYTLDIKPGYNVSDNNLIVYAVNGSGDAEQFRIGLGFVQNTDSQTFEDLTTSDGEKYNRYVFTIEATYDVKFVFEGETKEQIEVSFDTSNMIINDTDTTQNGLQVDAGVADNINQSTYSPNYDGTTLDIIDNKISTLDYGNSIRFTMSPNASYEKSGYIVSFKLGDKKEEFIFGKRGYVDSVNAPQSTSEKVKLNNVLVANGITISEVWQDNKIVITIEITRVASNMEIVVSEIEINSYTISAKDGNGQNKELTNLSNVTYESNTYIASETSGETKFSFDLDKSFDPGNTGIIINLTRFAMTSANDGRNNHIIDTNLGDEQNPTYPIANFESGEYTFCDLLSGIKVVVSYTISKNYESDGITIASYTYNFTITGLYCDIDVAISEKLATYTIYFSNNVENYIESIKVKNIPASVTDLSYIDTTSATEVNLSDLLSIGGIGSVVEHGGTIVYLLTIKEGYRFNTSTLHENDVINGEGKYNNYFKTGSNGDGLYDVDYLSSGVLVLYNSHDSKYYQYTHINNQIAIVIKGVNQTNPSSNPIDISSAFAEASFDYKIYASGSIGNITTNYISGSLTSASNKFSAITDSTNPIVYEYIVNAKYTLSNIYALVKLTSKDGTSKIFDSEPTVAGDQPTLLTSTSTAFNFVTTTDGVTIYYEDGKIYVTLQLNCYYDIDIELTGFKTNIYTMSINFSGDSTKEDESFVMSYDYTYTASTLTITAKYNITYTAYIMTISGIALYKDNACSDAFNVVNNNTSLVLVNKVLTLYYYHSDADFEISLVNALCIEDESYLKVTCNNYSDEFLRSSSSRTSRQTDDIAILSNMHLKYYNLTVTSNKTDRIDITKNSAGMQFESGVIQNVYIKDRVYIEYSLPEASLNSSTEIETINGEEKRVLNFVIVKFNSNDVSDEESMMFVQNETNLTLFTLSIPSIEGSYDIEFSENDQVDKFDYSLDFTSESLNGNYLSTWEFMEYSSSSKTVTIKANIFIDSIYGGTDGVYDEGDIVIGHISIAFKNVNYISSNADIEISADNKVATVPYATEISEISIEVDRQIVGQSVSSGSITGVGCESVAYISSGNHENYFYVNYIRDYYDSIKSDVTTADLSVDIKLDVYVIENSTIASVFKIESDETETQVGSGTVINYGTKLKIKYDPNSNMDFTTCDGGFSGELAKDLFMIKGKTELEFDENSGEYTYEYVISKDNWVNFDPDKWSNTIDIVNNNKMPSRYQVGLNPNKVVSAYIESIKIEISSNQPLLFYSSMDRDDNTAISIDNKVTNGQYIYTYEITSSDYSSKAKILYYSVNASLYKAEVTHTITLVAKAGYEQALLNKSDTNEFSNLLLCFSNKTSELNYYNVTTTTYTTNSVTFSTNNNVAQAQNTDKTIYYFDVKNLDGNTYSMVWKLGEGFDSISFSGDSSVVAGNDGNGQFTLTTGHNVETTITLTSNSSYSEVNVFKMSYGTSYYEFTWNNGSYNVKDHNSVQVVTWDDYNDKGLPQNLSIGDDEFTLTYFYVECNETNKTTTITLTIILIENVDTAVTLSTEDINKYEIAVIEDISGVDTSITESWYYKVFNADGLDPKTSITYTNTKINLKGSNKINITEGQYIVIYMDLIKDYELIESIDQINTNHYMNGVTNKAVLEDRDYCILFENHLVNGDSLYFENSECTIKIYNVTESTSEGAITIRKVAKAPSAHTLEIGSDDTDYASISVNGESASSSQNYDNNTAMSVRYELHDKYSQLREGKIKIGDTEVAIDDQVKSGNGKEVIDNDVTYLLKLFTDEDDKIVLTIDFSITKDVKIDLLSASINQYTITVKYIDSNYGDITEESVVIDHIDYVEGEEIGQNKDAIEDISNYSGGASLGFTFVKWVTIEGTVTYGVLDLFGDNAFAGLTGLSEDLNKDGITVYALYTTNDIELTITYDSDLVENKKNITITPGQDFYYTTESAPQSNRAYRYISDIDIRGTKLGLVHDEGDGFFKKSIAKGTDDYINFLKSIMVSNWTATAIYTDATLTLSIYNTGHNSNLDLRISEILSQPGGVEGWLWQDSADKWAFNDTFQTSATVIYSAIELEIDSKQYYLYLEKTDQSSNANYIMKLAKLDNGSMVNVDMIYQYFENKDIVTSGYDDGKGNVLDKSSAANGGLSDNPTELELILEVYWQYKTGVSKNIPGNTITSDSDIQITYEWIEGVKYNYTITYNGSTYTTTSYEEITSLDKLLDCGFIKGNKGEVKEQGEIFDNKLLKEIITCANIWTDDNGKEIYYFNNAGSFGEAKKDVISDSNLHPKFTLQKVDESIADLDDYKTNGEIDYTKIKANTNVKKVEISIDMTSRGSTSYPYLIGSKVAWENIVVPKGAYAENENLNNKYFHLIKDVDLSDMEEKTGQYSYSLTLIGDDKTINREDYKISLFGELTAGSQVTDLKIVGGSSEIVRYNEDFWGVLASKIELGVDSLSGKTSNYSNITLGNVDEDGKLTDSIVENVAGITELGALAGKIYGSGSQEFTLSNIINNYNITANNAETVAGISPSMLSPNNKLQLTYLTNNGGITNNKNDGSVAGIGYVTSPTGSIESCVNKGDIKAIKGAYGLFGSTYINSITNSHNTGTIAGIDESDKVLKLGVGVADLMSVATVDNCHNKGNITAVGIDGYAIGVVRVGTGGGDKTITDCNNTGALASEVYNVGVVHSLESSNKVDITNCSNTGDFVLGGSIGVVYADSINTISGCYNKGNLSGIDVVGVVQAYNINTISGCYNQGDLTGDGYIIGVVFVESHVNTITGCYNNAQLVAADIIVGVAYVDTLQSMSGCYNSGEITCENGEVSGVLYMYSGYADATITNCYNSNVLTGHSVAGVVYGGEVNTIDHCYNLGEINGSSTSVGVVYTGGANKLSYLYNMANVGYNNSSKDNDGNYTSWNDATEEAYAIAYIGGNPNKSIEISHCDNNRYLKIDEDLKVVVRGSGSGALQKPDGTVEYFNIVGSKASMIYINNCYENSGSYYFGNVNVYDNFNFMGNIYCKDAGAGIIIYETTLTNISLLSDGVLKLGADNTELSDGHEDKPYEVDGNHNFANIFSDGSAAGLLYLDGYVDFVTAGRGNIVEQGYNYGNVTSKMFASGIATLGYEPEYIGFDNCINRGDISSVYTAGIAVVEQTTASYYTEFLACANVNANLTGDVVAGIGCGFNAVRASHCVNFTGKNQVDDPDPKESQQINYSVVGAGLFVVQRAVYLTSTYQMGDNVAYDGFNMLWADKSWNDLSSETSINFNNMKIVYTESANYDPSTTMTIGAGIVAVLQAETDSSTNSLNDITINLITDAEGNTVSKNLSELNTSIFISGCVNAGEIKNESENAVNNWNYSSGIAHITDNEDYKDDYTGQADTNNGEQVYGSRKRVSIFNNYNMMKAGVTGGTAGGILTTSATNSLYSMYNLINKGDITAHVVGAGIVSSLAQKDTDTTDDDYVSSAKFTFMQDITNEGEIKTTDKAEGSKIATFASGLACLIGDYNIVNARSVSQGSGDTTNLTNKGNIILGNTGLIGAGIAYASYIKNNVSDYKELEISVSGDLYTRNGYTSPTVDPDDPAYDIITGSILCAGLITEIVINNTDLMARYYIGNYHNGVDIGVADSNKGYVNAFIGGVYVVILESEFTSLSGVNPASHYYNMQPEFYLQQYEGYEDYWDKSGNVFLQRYNLIIKLEFSEVNP